MGNTLQKEKHGKYVSKDTSDRKIGDQPNKSNNSIKIKTVMVCDVSQNTNDFPSV